MPLAVYCIADLLCAKAGIVDTSWRDTADCSFTTVRLQVTWSSWPQTVITFQQACGQWSPSNCTALLLFDQQKTAGWPEHFYVNNLPIVVTWKCNSQELNISIVSPTNWPLHYHVTPSDYQAKHSMVNVAPVYIQFSSVQWQLRAHSACQQDTDVWLTSMTSHDNQLQFFHHSLSLSSWQLHIAQQQPADNTRNYAVKCAMICSVTGCLSQSSHVQHADYTHFIHLLEALLRRFCS